MSPFKMISIVRRSSTAAEHQLKGGRKSVGAHLYEKPPFSNLEELIQYFLNNVIFNENGLILLNKPYGLKKEAVVYMKNKTKLITKVPIADKIDQLSFEGALSPLARKLNQERLELVKVPERHMSGVSMLSADDIAHRRVRKSFSEPSLSLFTYLMVCVGIPFKLSGNAKLGMTIHEKNGIKKAILVENYSNRSLERQLVVPVKMNHHTLATNDSLNVSLVRIQNNRNKWHAVRAFCGLRLLAPILGDVIYGSCIRTVCGKSMPINPFSPLSNFPSKLPITLLSALDLKPETKTIIPSHLHLSGVNLPKFGKKNIYVAKPPDHFLWTCQKLNLTIPDIYLQNGVVDEDSYFKNPVMENNSKTT